MSNDLNRLFNEFLADASYVFLDKNIQDHVSNKNKYPWTTLFSLEQQKRDFDKRAYEPLQALFKKLGKKIPKRYEIIEDMDSFIEQNFGKEHADKYFQYKTMPYRQINDDTMNENDYKFLRDHIKDFILRKPLNPINQKLTRLQNEKLVKYYNVFNDTKVSDLNEAYKDMEIYNLQQKHNNELTQRDEENKKVIEETITKKDKEHEEEKKKIRIENDARLEKELVAEKNRTEKRMKRQQQYDVNNGDDELKDVKLIHEDYSDDSNNNIDIEDAKAIDKRISKYAEMDKAKNAAQQIDEKIKEDAIITRAAMDSDFYNQLDDGIKSVLRPKIEEKKAIIERSKVIRYLLPKERPKWEKATMSKGVNPLLSRGAWGI